MSDSSGPERNDGGGGTRLRQLLHARIDGELTPGQAAELDRFLARDPAAAAEAAAFERMSRLARLARPPVPEGFAERVLEAIDRLEAPVVSPARSPGEWLRGLAWPARFLRPGFAGAVALVVVTLLVGTLVVRHAPSPPPPATTPPVPEFVAHRFELVAPQARRVCLVGDFNNWTVCQVPLVKDATTGAWSIQLDLPRGRHQYMFVLDDGNWVTDPSADVRVDDGFGNQNAVLFL